MPTYTRLDGRVVDLTPLTAEERTFFDRCLAGYRDGMPWPDFVRLAEGTENPLIRATGGMVTRAVWKHPLFQAVRDLEHRLGIHQGYLRPGPEDDPTRDPLKDEWIRVPEAARRKGITVPALHLAIKRGDVIARPAKPGGVWLAVSMNSLTHWRPNSVRQAAGRKRSVSRTAGD